MSHQDIIALIHHYIKSSLHKDNITMSDNKTITIKVRVDSQTLAAMQSRADIYTKGNLSAFIRCASLSYNEAQAALRDNPQLSALLNTAIKQIGRLGTNTNQIVKHINEQQKLFPYSLRSSDLLPFSQYSEDIEKIKQMLAYLYNMINSEK